MEITKWKNGDPKIDSVMVVSKSLAGCFTVLNRVGKEIKIASKRGLDKGDHLKNHSIK